jgi:hypothetical protein
MKSGGVTILGFLCLFFPAIIAVYIFSIITKRKVGINFFLLYYAIYVILINFIMISVLTFIFNKKYLILQTNSFSNIFILKYISLAMLLSCLLPFLFKVIKENINLITKSVLSVINIIIANLKRLKKPDYLFDIGFFIILFVFVNLLITTILFIFKINITSYNFIVANLMTLGLAIYIMRKDKTSLKYMIIIIGITALIIFLSIFISGKTYDLTWDGNTYHKVAIGQLKDGWNPIYEDIEDFNKAARNPLKLSHAYGLWNNHYAKAYWLYSANVYKVTNNIESGKSLMLLAGISGLLIFLSYFSLKMNIIYASILSLLIVLNPVYFTQIQTYYNDGLMYIFLSLLILSLTQLCDQTRKQLTLKRYLLYIIVLAILINIKFTGFVYAGIYSLTYYIYILIKPKLRKDNLKKLTGSTAIALIIGVFIIGLSTYPKNFKVMGHIFYPLFGENKVDIITSQQPKSFQYMNRLTKFFIANFSKTDNILYVHDKAPELKIPFTIDENELYHLTSYDIRIGGYGVLFSGVLIISLIIIIYGLFKIYKINQALFWLLLLPLMTTLFLILILEENWWARYFPQLYWLPILAIIILIIMPSKNSKRFIFNIILIAVMFLNLHYFCKWNFVLNNEAYKNINKDIASLKILHNNNQKLYIYNTHFESLMYNFKDKMGDCINEDFIIIYDIDTFDKEKYQYVGSIYQGMSELYIDNNQND